MDKMYKIIISSLSIVLLSSCVPLTPSVISPSETPSIAPSVSTQPGTSVAPSVSNTEPTSPSFDVPSTPIEYNINITQTLGGTIQADKEVAKANEIITLSYVADTGYDFIHYLLDGEILETNTFVMPNHDVTVSALFHDEYYDITLTYNENLYFDVTETHVKYGEAVVIDYMPVTNYVLSYFLVNGEPIQGDTFIMPKEDVVIEGVVELAYKESDIAIDLPVQGRDEFYTRSNWFFEYKTDGIYVTTYVYDHFLVDNPATVPDKGYRDNVELIISPLENVKGLSYFNSVNAMVSIDGEVWYRRATSLDTFTFENLPSEQYFRYSSKIHRYLDKEGFNGYVVNMFFSYDLWGIDPNNTQFVIMPSHRNTVNYPYKTYWDHLKTGPEGSTEYLDISTHPVLNKDGTISENPYKEVL